MPSEREQGQLYPEDNGNVLTIFRTVASRPMQGQNARGHGSVGITESTEYFTTTVLKSFSPTTQRYT